jgi:beta-phosphoglucomutase-like phosphatase (HAD superfamily)
MKKVISFDLDGTLVDARYGDMVWNTGIPSEYAKKYGMTFDEARAFIRARYESVGDGDIAWYEIEHWLERFSLDVAPVELLDRYREHIALLPDAREVIESLRDRYTLVIASNAARMFVEKELGETGLSVLLPRRLGDVGLRDGEERGEVFPEAPRGGRRPPARGRPRGRPSCFRPRCPFRSRDRMLLHRWP